MQKNTPDYETIMAIFMRIKETKHPQEYILIPRERKDRVKDGKERK